MNRTAGRSDSRTMQAALLVAPERFEMCDVPRPACPEGGLLLRVLACAICASHAAPAGPARRAHSLRTTGIVRRGIPLDTSVALLLYVKLNVQLNVLPSEVGKCRRCMT